MDRPSKRSGNWLLTYSDFMTLLMTFFIVLYILTPGVEEQKFKMVISSFNGQPGVLTGGMEVFDKILMQKKMRERHWSRLRETVEAQDLQAQIKVDLIPEGIRIVLGEAITFNSGSAVLLDEGKPILNKLLRQLVAEMSNKIVGIEIRGHTDNVPVADDNKQYDSNWELGMDRANSVLEFILENSKLPDKLFKISSFGEYRPRYKNTTPQNKRKNRRVEIFVQYEKIREPEASGNNDVAHVINTNLKQIMQTHG